jgi:hypothetical protein
VDPWAGRPFLERLATPDGRVRQNWGAMKEHMIESIPIIKMDGGLIGYRWKCSCGRERDGCHRTPEKAIEAGQNHIGPITNCCCNYGLGVAGEWPEFECMQCPVHKGEGLMGDDRLCRRHKKGVSWKTHSSPQQDA